MADIHAILKMARTRKATDVHIVSAAPVLLRIEGELLPATKEPLTATMARELSYSLLTPQQITNFEQALDLDFMASDAERNRYRVNISFNDGTIGAVIRILPSDPMPLEALRLPE